MTKEGIAQNEQLLLLPQCFPLLVIGYPFNYRDTYLLTTYFQSRLLQICRMRERVKNVPTCYKSSGDDFENNYVKYWKRSLNVRTIIEKR